MAANSPREAKLPKTSEQDISAIRKELRKTAGSRLTQNSSMQPGSPIPEDYSMGAQGSPIQEAEEYLSEEEPPKLVLAPKTKMEETKPLINDPDNEKRDSKCSKTPFLSGPEMVPSLDEELPYGRYHWLLLAIVVCCDYVYNATQFGGKNFYDKQMDNSWGEGFSKQRASMVFWGRMALGWLWLMFADRFGRKTVLYCAVACMTVLQGVQCIVPDNSEDGWQGGGYASWTIMLVVGGCFHAVRTLPWLLIEESISKSYKGEMCATVGALYCVTAVVYILLDWMIVDRTLFTSLRMTFGGEPETNFPEYIASQDTRFDDSWRGSWRTQVLLNVGPPLLFVLAIYFFVMESPNWLWQTGRHKEAEEVASKIAGKQITFPVCESGKQSKTCIGSLKDIGAKLKNCKALTCVSILALWWTITIFVFYNYLLNPEIFGTHKHFTQLIQFAFQIPGNLLQGWLCKRVPAPKAFLIFNIATIIIGIVYGTLFELTDFENGWGQRIVVALYAVSISAAFQTVYLLTSMVAPVQMKSGVFAFCNIFARSGCAITPLIGPQQLPGSSPFWLYTGLTFGACLVYIFFNVDALHEIAEEEEKELREAKKESI